VRIVVAHSQLSTFGGGERCVLALLRYLSQRHDVTLWAGGYIPSRTYADLASFPRRDVRAAGWLLRTPRADAVITHSFGAHLLALHHPRTLCYLHTMRSVYLRRENTPLLVARRRLDGAALRHAAVALTNSEFTARQARQRYQRAIEVVPPGADEQLFHLPAQAGTYGLFVGRLAPEKGIERLIRWSFALPFDLVLVGEGAPDYVAYLRSLAGPRTYFRGPLTGDALFAAYAGSRFLAFLPYEEEFGLAAVEAMATAKPVVAVPEGGLTELVEPEKTGLFVHDAGEFQSATRRLFESDAFTTRLGRAARECAQTYTWDSYARRIEALCEQLTRRGDAAVEPARS
jgi:glycosyltransferase involved in cell wall biosynthesis